MYRRKDPYYFKAKKEGYRSRAAYKLLDIAGAEKIIRPGDCVIDAGAAPGGWIGRAHV
jgi:23S rRNA (uridine2552-2'-O)-methyltransferase